MIKGSRIYIIRLVCRLIFGLGVFGMIADYVSRYAYHFPLNLGIVLGNGATIIVGLVGDMLSEHIIKLEQRLDKLERE